MAFLAGHHSAQADFTNDELALWKIVAPHTLTGIERIITLTRVVKYIEKCEIPGDYVECGVFRGGSLLAMAMTTDALSDRLIYGFDTFDGGTTLPTEVDGHASLTDAKRYVAGVSDSTVAACSIEGVRSTILKSGVSETRLRLVAGLVEDTIPAAAPNTISILRLDTDWHKSTLHTLTELYPRLSRGGVLIIDDYGHFDGCKQAVDQYIEANKLKLLLNRVDYSCRIAVKL